MSDLEERTRILTETRIKSNELESYLKKLERTIFDIETKYLESSQNTGNILKGYEAGFTNKSKISNQSSISLNKRTRFSNTERIFSQSSSNNIMIQNEYMNNSNMLRQANTNQNSANSKHSSTKKKKKMLSLKKRKSNSQLKAIDD